MNLGREFYTMAFITLVVVILWVGFELYFNLSSVNIDPNVNTYLTPISGSFDTKMFSEIMERVNDSLPISPDTFTVLIGNTN